MQRETFTPDELREALGRRNFAYADLRGAQMGVNATDC